MAMGKLWETFEVMPVDVYEGMNGDLVLTQEWSDLEKERYTRVILPMKDARALVERILSVIEKSGT